MTIIKYMGGADYREFFAGDTLDGTVDATPVNIIFTPGQPPNDHTLDTTDSYYAGVSDAWWVQLLTDSNFLDVSLLSPYPPGVWDQEFGSEGEQEQVPLVAPTAGSAAGRALVTTGNGSFSFGAPMDGGNAAAPNQTIRVRRDTQNGWINSNPILSDSEIGYEKGTGRVKVGDGATRWNALSYIGTGLLTSGGDMSGDINMDGHTITGGATPTGPTDYAIKSYVDSVAVGLDIKPACQWATVASLPANTYNNGTAGVGATLTANANGVLTVDGGTPALDDRIIVQDEGNAAHNGIYSLTTLGSGGAEYVLTRVTDMDQAAEIPVALAYVSEGTVNAGGSFVVSGSSSYVVGTTNIVWSPFTPAQTAWAGDLEGSGSDPTVIGIQTIPISAAAAKLVSQLNVANVRVASASVGPGEYTVFEGSTPGQTIALPTSTAPNSSVNTLLNLSTVPVLYSPGSGTTMNMQGRTGSITVPANGGMVQVLLIGTVWFAIDTNFGRAYKGALSEAAPGSTPAIDTDFYEVVEFTNINTAILDLILTGTPQLGDTLRIGFTDNGVQQSIFHGTGFENGPTPLPTLTKAGGQRMDVGYFLNPTSGNWRCMTAG